LPKFGILCTVLIFLPLLTSAPKPQAGCIRTEKGSEKRNSYGKSWNQAVRDLRQSHCNLLLRARSALGSDHVAWGVSSLVLKPTQAGDCTASLSNLFHYFMKNFSIVGDQNLACFGS